MGTSCDFTTAHQRGGGGKIQIIINIAFCASHLKTVWGRELLNQLLRACYPIQLLLILRVSVHYFVKYQMTYCLISNQ